MDLYLFIYASIDPHQIQYWGNWPLGLQNTKYPGKQNECGSLQAKSLEWSQSALFLLPRTADVFHPTTPLFQLARL